MKVILFIGHHKVGSTALQIFLAQNSVALLRAGILYPSVDFEGCAVNMSKLLQGADSAEHLPINAREPHNALAFRMLADETGGEMPRWHRGMPAAPQMLKAINMQIRYLNPEVVVLAAEVFSNFAADAPSAITKLAALFEGHEVRIIATLRRVDDYLASWHGQRLKFGHKIEALRDTATSEYIKSIHFDYRLMLDKWCGEFPNADFIMRNYSDVLKSGGACEDFIEQSGIMFPEGLNSVSNANPSFHQALYEIARIGNRELSDSGAAELKQFLLRIQPRLKLPQSKSIEMFGVENRDLMANNFAPIHEYLSEKNKGGAFFFDIDEISSVRDINELDAANDALAQIQSLIARPSIFKKLMPSADEELTAEVKSLLMNMSIATR